MTVLSTRRVLGGVVGSNFNDPTNERLIYLSAAGLVGVGIALLVGTILWWRRGRQEHPALAPLEVLGTRSWAKAPEGERRRKLEKVRIAGAGGAAPDEPERSEPLDLEAMVRSTPQAFDDLREPSAVVEPVVEPPVEPEAAAIDAAAEPAAAVQPVEVMAEPVQVVAEPGVTVQPTIGVEHLEAEHAPVNRNVVAPIVDDPDATSLTAERPSAEHAGLPGRNS